MQNFIPRDISWLSFNERVLQEAADKSVPLYMRIRFLGIFSNNLDEFFKVRVAVIKRAIAKQQNPELLFEEPPETTLHRINKKVLELQSQFEKIWEKLQEEMAKEGVFIKAPEELSVKQYKFVKKYYQDEVESNVIPLVLDETQALPYLRDDSLYLGVAMRKTMDGNPRLAIVEVPTFANDRFIKLPSEKKQKHIILLEDILKINLPLIFSYFGVDNFSAHTFKITRDAGFELGSDTRIPLEVKIAHGIKSRRKGKPIRFTYDQNIDQILFGLLLTKLQLDKKDSIIPGRKIQNFKHFMDFPNLFREKHIPKERRPFKHPKIKKTQRVTDAVLKEDILLSPPYHNFRPIIDLLRESAMDPHVTSIKISVYRLASDSKIANALINAARNGKKVTVVIELQARFDEENNLDWKEIFETEGVEVLTGVPNKKVHSKLCLIRKIKKGENINYGFISTGNFNEKTAALYADHILLTADKDITEDIYHFFELLKKPSLFKSSNFPNFKNLWVSPNTLRNTLNMYINKEITAAKKGEKAHIIIKVNALSDHRLIEKIREAVEVGVQVDMIVRSIFCAKVPSSMPHFRAISIVDEYLEHARVFYFYNGGAENTFLSSADWMVRNLDHRLEAAVEIKSPKIKKELKKILDIQLLDNVKARVLDSELSNKYVQNTKEKCQAQIAIHQFLKRNK